MTPHESPTAASRAVPRITAVVVLYNSGEVVADLVSSLPEAFAGLDYGLVVVDNGSHDDGADIVRRLAPDATIISSEKNLGYAAGINRGLQAAGETDAVLVLNPDVRLRPGSVTELLRAQEDPRVGIAVPRIVDGAGSLYHSIRRDPSVSRAFADALLGARRADRYGSLSEIEYHDEAYDAAHDIDWATGAVMLFSPACRAAVEPWDESFFLYSEEVDISLRARDAGFSILYWPRATATHLKGESQVRPELWALLVANRIELFRRRHGRHATRLFRYAVLLRETSRALLGSEKSRFTCHVMRRPQGREELVRRLQDKEPHRGMSSV